MTTRRPHAGTLGVSRARTGTSSISGATSSTCPANLLSKIPPRRSSVARPTVTSLADRSGSQHTTTPGRLLTTLTISVAAGTTSPSWCKIIEIVPSTRVRSVASATASSAICSASSFW